MSRAEYIYQASLRGLQVPDIARELGITNQDVRGAIQRQQGLDVKEQTPEERQSLLMMQQARYEFMLSKLWDQIEYGEVKAITAGMQLVDRIVKINKLDAEDAEKGQATILVVGGAESDYIENLKTMVPDTDG